MAALLIVAVPLPGRYSAADPALRAKLCRFSHPALTPRFIRAFCSTPGIKTNIIKISGGTGPIITFFVVANTPAFRPYGY